MAFWQPRPSARCTSMSTNSPTRIQRLLSQAIWFAKLRLMVVGYRLRNRIDRWKWRRLLHLRRLIRWAVELRIRCLHEAAKQEGADKKIDQMIFLATQKILLPAHFENPLPGFFARPADAEDAAKLVADYEAHKGEVDDLVARALEDEAVRNARDGCFAVEAIMSLEIKQGERAAYFAQAGGIDEGSLAELKFLPAQVEVDIKKYKKWYRAMREYMGDKEAVKLTFSIDDATKWIAALYAVLLVGAYFRAQLLYGAFGISVTSYFGVTDYLAAGVDAIGSAALASVWGIFVLFAGVHHGSRKPIALIEYERKRPNYGKWLIGLLIVIGLLGALIDRRAFWNFIPLGPVDKGR